MRFGDDWPGVFLRGDSASYYAMCLTTLLANVNAGELITDSLALELLQLHGLLATLQGVQVTGRGDPPDTQALRPWAECVATSHPREPEMSDTGETPSRTK